VVNEEDILNTDQLRHNHNLCSDTEINRQIVSVSCKRKATENLYIQPKHIILKELSENNQLTNGLISNDFNVLRKSIYRSIILLFQYLIISLIPSTIT
jgi:hypothetical protein